MSAIEETEETRSTFSVRRSRARSSSRAPARWSSASSIAGAGRRRRQVGQGGARSPVRTARSTRRIPSSWLDINADNTIAMRTGIAEMGQGSASTAFAQIAAEELNVPYSAITQVVIGDTDRTPAAASRPGYMGARRPNIRKVAAYIYQALLSMASTQFGVPVASLTVTNGVDLRGREEGHVRPARGRQAAQPDDPGHRRPRPASSGVTVLGNPPVKPVSAYQVVGQSIPMRTIPPIVTGTATYVGDVRLPGMLHARVVHPKTLGSKLISVGKLDKKEFPNTQIVVKGNLVAVVDPQEYIAIQAASVLAAQDEVDDMGGAARQRQHLQGDAGARLDVDARAVRREQRQSGAAFASARRRLLATYKYPVREARSDRTDGRRRRRPERRDDLGAHPQPEPAGTAGQIALMMNISLDNVIVRWYDGSGHYGRSNGGNTGAEEEAVILSSIVGKPVRVQWMRWDDMQWSTQHPPVLSDVRPAWTRTESWSRSMPTHYEPAGQDDRPVGALLAGLPTMAAPAVSRPPANSSRYRERGLRSVGSTTRCRTRCRPATGRSTSARIRPSRTSTSRSACAATACARPVSGSRTSRRSR